jgi:hypothetical protein
MGGAGTISGTPAVLARLDPEVVLPLLALSATLFLGALAIAAVSRWMKKKKDPGILSAGDQLTQFREMYDRGEISREEFERIRARLAEPLRRELNLPAEAAPMEITEKDLLDEDGPPAQPQPQPPPPRQTPPHGITADRPDGPRPG